MTVCKRADELGEGIRPDMSRIFVDGFYQWLGYFSKDKEKLAKAFAHMFRLEVFYVALVDGQAAGMAACTDGIAPPVRLDATELKRHLGWLKGTIAARVLHSQFENHPYPFEITPGMGSVEFVAVDERFRGKGVAASLLEYIHTHCPYQAFVLEVADTNAPAVRLYQKLGYTERMRVAEKHAKRTGFDYLVYMERKDSMKHPVKVP